jgi:hypothetical protein
MKPVRFLLASAFLLTSIVAYTQKSIGFHTGVNFSSVYATDGISTLAPDFKSTTSLQLGVVSEFDLGDFFAVQPELNYTVKGFRIRETGDIKLFDIPLPIGVDVVSRFGYVEMPLLLKAKFGNDHIKAYLMAGPAAGVAVHGRLITKAKAFFSIRLLDENIDLDVVGYERLELSGIGGGGLEILTSRGKIFMDAWYQIGLTELYDIPVFDEQIKNRGLSLNVGYLMNF